MRRFVLHQSPKMSTEELFVYSKRKKPHTFPLPSERNIHAVISGDATSFSEQEIKEELKQKDYSPHHIIRLSRSGGLVMPGDSDTAQG
nr:unnamed protein product [Callosobruchus chinensis]